MPRIKLTLTAGLAVLALSALAVSTASAGEWDINGKPLPKGSKAALASSPLALSSVVIAAAGVEVECTAGELGLAEGELIGPDELKAKDLTLKNCSTAPPCRLQSPTILTLGLHGLAELDGPLATYVKLLPLPSKTLTAINFEGESCALTGTQIITGTIDALAHEGRDPRVSQQGLLFSLPGSLKVGSSEVSLKALADLKLASGETWNFL